MAKQGRKGRPAKAVRKPPAAVFALSLLVLVGALFIGGLRVQVAMKRRTSQRDMIWIEDTANGTGTRQRVLVGKADTGGEYFTMEQVVRAGAPGAYKGRPGSPPPHVHTFQEETFVVKSGSFGSYAGSKANESVVHAGDTVVIPAGVDHTFWNADNSSDLVVELSLRPAGAGEAFFETYWGLGHEYGSPGAVSPLQALLTLARGGIVLTDMPPWAWKLIHSVLVPFAELIGYKAFYPEYTTTREGSAAS